MVTKNAPYSQPAPKPGVYEGIPFHVYASWDAVNAGLLKWVDHSPAYAIYNKLNPDADADEKKHNRVGRAMHTLVSQPELFTGEYVVKPSTYTNKDGEEKKWNGSATVCKKKMALWLSEGMTLLSPDEFGTAKGMADSLRGHPLAAKILDGGQFELSLVWIDEKTGLTCKARLDAFKAGVIADWKSVASSASPSAVMREAAKLKYYIQLHHYEQGTKAVGLDEYPELGFFFVEKYAPYLCAFYKPDITFLELGKVAWERLMFRTAECTKNNEWPGYDQGVNDLFAPPWAGTELGI